jgi:hypothetical protein
VTEFNFAGKAVRRLIKTKVVFKNASHFIYSKIKYSTLQTTFFAKIFAKVSQLAPNYFGGGI